MVPVDEQRFGAYRDAALEFTDAMNEGKRLSQIRQTLAKNTAPDQLATLMAITASTWQRRRETPGLWRLAAGVALVTVAAGISLLTFMARSDGGTYIVFVGATAVGLLWVLRGLWAFGQFQLVNRDAEALLKAELTQRPELIQEIARFQRWRSQRPLYGG
ncbi:MAG: hypothetical protein ACR2HN_07655 [Tepidiformaceae bacterium]